MFGTHIDTLLYVFFVIPALSVYYRCMYELMWAMIIRKEEK